MSRLTGDATLVSLLGGSGRIYKALEKTVPQVNSLTYLHLGAIPTGSLRLKNVESRDETYMFNIFHPQFEVVKDRLYRLLHQYRFTNPSDATIVYSEWDWDGPDRFDEDLMVPTAQVRYKFYVVRQALAPI